MAKALVVIDMQNDFVTGSLGSEAAQACVPHVVDLIKQAIAGDDRIVLTEDTHGENYLETLEGKKLPVPHCKIGTSGRDLVVDVSNAINGYDNCAVTPKYGFGVTTLSCLIPNGTDSITICGLCTDICVVSNALILRAALPNTPITVVAKACAGTTPEKHKAALAVMESCQIDVVYE